MAEKITITPITLRDQKPTDIKECYIELFENYLRYKVEFYATEPKDINDYDLGWEEGVYNNFEIIVMKNNVAGVEKSITTDKKWGVYIRVDGFQNDLKIYSRMQTTAQSLFDKLKEWLCPTPTPTS